jgi:hypothetical protein
MRRRDLGLDQILTIGLATTVGAASAQRQFLSPPGNSRRLSAAQTFAFECGAGTNQTIYVGGRTGAAFLDKSSPRPSCTMRGNSRGMGPFRVTERT